MPEESQISGILAVLESLMPICRLAERRAMRISGPDARPFLQGLVSNDIDKAGPERAVWAALLTPQGKYVADFFVLGDAEGLLLEVRTEDVASLTKKLTLHKLRAKVEIGDAKDDFVVYAAFGEMAKIEIPPGAKRYADPRLPAAGRRYLVPEATRPAFEQSLTNGLTSSDQYERHRIALGLPAAPFDLIADKSILLEAGFDELGGVDWDKGCYMGQELTARTKYRGLIKKRLVPIRIEGPAPVPETRIFDGESEVGEMRSAAGDTGIALLKLDAIKSGKPLHGGDATLTPVKPGWMVLPEDNPAE